MFDDSPQRPGRQGAAEPQQRRPQADGAEKTHAPRGDDHVAEILRLQDGGQRLGRVSGALLAFERLRDAV
ncbi:hypothetical protein [Brevundimonas sp. KM4]|uniref:hypothetical protein n=1 Tax=Brevundimonas sp. KM4 TaxID=1628191 RepID=UPI001E618C83|nr:hypothetical protein [Brevundimonas sp. KM4]